MNKKKGRILLEALRNDKKEEKLRNKNTKKNTASNTIQKRHTARENREPKQKDRGLTQTH